MFSKSSLLIFVAFLTLGLFLVIKLLEKESHKEGKSDYHIGIAKIIDHPALDKTEKGIIDYLEKSSDKKIKIFSESAQSDLAIANQIIQKFIQRDLDVIVTLGTTITQIAMKKTKKIPIVFASVTDPMASGLVESLENPAGNITGVSNFSPLLIAKQLIFFKKLLPNLQKLGIIYNAGEANSLLLLQKTEEEAKKLGIEIKPLAAQNTNEAVFAAKNLANSVEAIFINNDNTALAAMAGIVTAADKIPVFSSDLDSFNQGILAALGPDQYKIGEEAGKLVLALLKGEILSSPIIFPKNEEIIINREKVTKFGLIMPLDLIDKIK
jgi:putative ABC transport system substrate-binding protein